MEIIKVVDYPPTLVPHAVYMKEMPGDELEISVSDQAGTILKKLGTTNAKSYTDTQISALLGSVPVAGNTLNKLYTMIQAGFTLTTATLGNLAPKSNPIFSGRIQADFGNAAVASRVMFQSNVLNNNTNLELLTNGLGTAATLIAGCTDDPTNTSIIYIQSRSDTAETRVESTRRGTGAYFPMNFYTGGSIRMAIDASGNVTIGGSAAQTAAMKNASGGIAGLTGYNINLKNDAGTITSLLANANTAIRTYTLPDKTGVVAMLSDVTPVAHVGSGGTAHANATTTVSGFMSSADKTKLDGIGTGANVTTVAGRTGAVVLTKADVSLGNVDNTSDLNKPVSTAQAAADTAATSDAVSTIRAGVVTGGDTLAKLYTLITNINTLITSDDLTLDSVQEIVTYIKSEQTAINSLGTTKINISDIVDVLTDTSTNKPLSAAQGKALKDVADALAITVGTKVTAAQAAAAAPVQTVAGRTGAVVLTKTDIGLNNVDNTSDATVLAAALDAVKTSPINVVSTNDINCGTGNYFTKSISANTTLTFSNIPTGKAYGFTLKVNHTGGAITFPGTVQWPGGTLPTLTTGKVHLLSFVTDDGGVIWHGVANTNYAS